MSLIDPESRWWNRDSTRRVLAYVCWTLALLSAAGGMMNVMADEAAPLPSWVGFATILALPLMLGGTFLIAFGTPDEVDSRLIVWPLGGLFIALGAGAIVGGYLSPRGLEWWHLEFVALSVAGVIAIVVSILYRRRSRRNDALQRQVERAGLTTTGIVTRARGYMVDYQRVTRITVRFTDSSGDERWASDTVSGSVSKGQRMRVQYAPDQLGRRAAVILSGPGSH